MSEEQQAQDGYYDNTQEYSEEEGYSEEEEAGEWAPEDVLFEARCIYPFQSTCDVELNLQEGDIVEVTRNDVGGGWWEGQVEGRHGLFPEKYVEEITEGGDGGGGGDEPAAAAAPAAHAAHAAAAAADGSASTYHEIGPGSHVIRAGQRWASEIEAFVVTATTNEKKGTKLGGMKQFTTYDISNTSTGHLVARRYKHFTWLHDRLHEQFAGVSVPPLPDKQVQGRFQADFIENRRRGLQRFLNRVANHPVLGASSVFRHFLSVTDQKQWKSGKRRHEAEASASKFLSSVQLDEPLPPTKDVTLESCFAFSHWLDKQVAEMQKEINELCKSEQGRFQSYSRLAVGMAKFGERGGGGGGRPGYKAFWADSEGPAVTVEETLDGVAEVGAGLQAFSDMLHDQLDRDSQALYDLVREYAGVLKTIPGLKKQHENAWQDYKAAKTKDTVGHDELEGIRTRCNVVSSVVMAEFRHFHESFVTDISRGMRQYLRQKADFHAEAATVWKGLIDNFPDI